MKIAAYEVRLDEKPVIEGLCKKYGIELISTPAIWIRPPPIWPPAATVLPPWARATIPTPFWTS